MQVLAKKMTVLYKLAKEQLSAQHHYDFGLRALKSVLVMAGSLKRSSPDMSEALVLMRALRDMNLPKFVYDDVPLFLGLINDLFPGERHSCLLACHSCMPSALQCNAGGTSRCYSNESDSTVEALLCPASVWKQPCRLALCVLAALKQERESNTIHQYCLQYSGALLFLCAACVPCSWYMCNTDKPAVIITVTCKILAAAQLTPTVILCLTVTANPLQSCTLQSLYTHVAAGMDCPRVRYPQLNDVVEADLAEQGYQVLTDAGQQVDKVIQLYEVSTSKLTKLT